MDGTFRFVMQTGPRAGQTITLNAASITVGRYPLAEIVLDDADIAARHALLTRRDTGYWIADLGSDSGTYINGRCVGAEAVNLAGGDIVLFGTRTSAVFVDESQPPAKTSQAPSSRSAGTTDGGTHMDDVPETWGATTNNAAGASDVIDAATVSDEQTGMPPGGAGSQRATTDGGPHVADMPETWSAADGTAIGEQPEAIGSAEAITNRQPDLTDLSAS